MVEGEPEVAGLHLEVVVVAVIAEDAVEAEAVAEDLTKDHQQKYAKLVLLCMVWREKWSAD